MLHPVGGRSRRLSAAVERGDACLTGVILQEILQGFPSLERTRRLKDYLAPFPLLDLHRGDFVFAAEIRNKCRSKGLGVTTIDPGTPPGPSGEPPRLVAQEYRVCGPVMIFLTTTAMEVDEEQSLPGADGGRAGRGS